MSGVAVQHGENRKTPISARSFFLTNAPYSMLAAALPGILNYGIILFLTHDRGFADAGSYRFLLSIHGRIGLVALAETQKIYIRSVVAGEHSALPALWFNRLLFAAMPFGLLAACYIMGLLLNATFVSSTLLLLAAASALIYTTDYYIGHLQSQERFSTLLGVELGKYGAALAAFSIAIQTENSVQIALLVMLLSIALGNLILSAVFTPSLFDFGKTKDTISRLLRSSPARQARTYSFANILPASLEHVDKLLIGLVFGLEWLGIYTLAFSTGRLIYNIIKPAFYIYYRRFVDDMPSRSLLWKLGIMATSGGVLSAGTFLLLIGTWPFMGQFVIGAPVSVILFLGYGIGIVRAIYVQAFTLNRSSKANHAWRACLWASLLISPLLILSLFSSPAAALILIAVQYPMRDAVTVIVLARYRRIGS